LGLDLLEIFRRNSVGKIDIIIEAVFDWRPGGELRFWPDFQNRRGQDVRRRMPEPFDVRHLGSLFQCFAVVVHERPVKLTTKKAKDTKNLWHRKSSAAAFYFQDETNFAIAPERRAGGDRLSSKPCIHFGVRNRA